MSGEDYKDKGRYAKFMSKEYKVAWNKLWMKTSGVVYFKNLDDDVGEDEVITKL